MRLIAISFSAFCLLSTVAHAAIIAKPSALGPFITAPMLLSACTQEDPGVHCDPYIAGVVDSITSNGGTLENNAICITSDVSIDKLRNVVINFIRAHPELPQGAIAASEVATAITEAYPCTKSSAGGDKT